MDRNSIGGKKFDTEFVSPSVTKHTIYASGDGTPIYQKWQWHREIGMGRRGLVWQEVEPTFKLNRACKKVNKEVYTRWPEVISNNIRLSKSRRHDLFVDFHGWFEHEGFIYLAVEYFENGNMEKCLRSSLEEEEDAKPITRQLLEGLQTMHEQGLVHHDIRPTSIYVVSQTPHWKVKLSNWGFARLLREESQTDLYDSSEDACYMPPEKQSIILTQLGDDILEIDKAADLWSLGVTLFQFLTGRRLFPDAISLKAYCQGVQRLPDDILADAGVSPEGIDFLHSLLKVDPKERLSAQAALKHGWLSPRPSTLPALAQQTRAPATTKEDDFIVEDLSSDQDYVDNITICADKEVRLVILGAWMDKFSSGKPMTKVTSPDSADQLIRQYVSSLKSLAKSDGTNYAESHLKVILLALAAAENNEMIARTLLKGKHDVDPLGRLYGLKAIHFASWMGSLDIVKLLVNECNAGTNVISGSTESNIDKGEKITMGKALKGTYTQYPAPIYPRSRNQVVDQTYRSQITLLAKFGQGYTPLHYAAARGRTLVVKFLLESGASIDALTESNMTPLMLSICNHQQHAARLLIVKKADLNMTTMWGRSAIRLAVENGLTAVVLLLIEGGALFRPHKLLINAIDHGYTDVVSVLVRTAGPEAINPSFHSSPSTTGTASSKEDQTPLYAAAASGFTPIVEFLLQQQAQLNLPCASGDLPLLAAVRNNHLNVTELLLVNGADPNLVPHAPSRRRSSVSTMLSTPTSALSLAVRNKNIKLVNLLLNHGANANGDPSEVDPPLILAIRSGNVEITQILLEIGGADVDLRSNRHSLKRSAVQEAADREFYEVLQVLLKHQGNSSIGTIDEGDQGDFRSPRAAPHSVSASGSTSITVFSSAAASSSTPVSEVSMTLPERSKARDSKGKGKGKEKVTNHSTFLDLDSARSSLNIGTTGEDSSVATSVPATAAAAAAAGPTKNNDQENSDTPPYWLWKDNAQHNNQPMGRRGAVGMR